MDRFLYEYECEELYHSIIDLAPHLITSIDEYGNIVDANNMIYELLGYNKEEIIGYPLLDLIHPEYHDKLVESCSGTIITNFDTKEKIKMINKAGDEVEVCINSSGTRTRMGDDDKSTKVLVIEKESDNDDKNPNIDDPRKNTPMQQAMVNNGEVYLDIIGHGVRNLTQLIISYSELLLKKPDLSNQFKRYFETTLDYSHAIYDLTSNVEKLANIKANGFKLCDMDAFKLLAEAIDEVQQKYPQRIILINQSISEDEVIIKSSHMLKDAFMNIINNAIKFNRAEKVTIDIVHSISKDGKNWKLEFQDYGPGIPDEQKDKIFHGFENVNNYVIGSGLGLVVVKEIIKHCDGQVWVEDRIKGDYTKGSNFVFLLPKCN
jgi:PAS domain S-box-containing protein